MSVIYYSSNENETALRLQKILIAEVHESIELYRSIEGFSKRLRQPDLEENIAIVLINSMAEIFQICSMRRLSSDIRVILILPDRSPEVISAGYKLHPRFISYADSDFKDVAVVLRRMIKLVEQKASTQDRICYRLH